MKAGRPLWVLPLALLLGSCADDAGERAWFVDEAELRGLDFVHASGFGQRALLPEIVTGGAALVDVDGDGDLDAYFVQGGWNLAAGVQPGSGVNALYRNRGDGYFAAVQDIGAAADPGYGMGVAAGDYDGDGDVDLYVTNLGENKLLQNDGSGVFTDVTERAGVGDRGWGTAALFADFDVDGDLDLFVVNYLHWSVGVERDCFTRGQPTYCAPTAYDAPAMDRVFRNEGDGRFTDMTVAAGLNRAFGNGLGAIAEDFDNDGLTDVFVANDRTRDQLWINQGDFRFVDEADLRGVAVDDNGIAKAGMGVAADDVDGDGNVDLLVVNFEGETDSFYLNAGEYFVDATARVGLAVPSRRHTRFGVALADFDNDAILDLYEANGKVDGDPAAVPDAFAEVNALFRGSVLDNGTPAFTEIRGSGDEHPLTSRALVVGDVDNDGALDVLIVNRDHRARLLMNRAGGGGNWLTLDVQNAAGAPALGARVTVRTALDRRATVRAAAGYLTSNDPRVHFGLGGEERVQSVSVQWLDGSVQDFGALQARRIHTLRPGPKRPAPQ